MKLVLERHFKEPHYWESGSFERKMQFFLGGGRCLCDAAFDENFVSTR